MNEEILVEHAFGLKRGVRFSHDARQDVAQGDFPRGVVDLADFVRHFGLAALFDLRLAVDGRQKVVCRLGRRRRTARNARRRRRQGSQNEIPRLIAHRNRRRGELRRRSPRMGFDRSNADR